MVYWLGVAKVSYIIKLVSVLKYTFITPTLDCFVPINRFVNLNIAR